NNKFWYGIQGFDADGGESVAESIIIDLDGISDVLQTKSLLGDVDVHTEYFYLNVPEGLPEIAVNDATIGTSFGSVNLGEPTSRSYTIMNNGLVPLMISNVTIDDDAFALINQPLNVSLLPGASLTFGVNFLAQDQGVSTANVRINSNDPNNPIYAFGVEANVEEEAPVEVSRALPLASTKKLLLLAVFLLGIGIFYIRRVV
ncbi:MAG: choice-of-anchor D domain-containing protein, partial [Bacteroidota bacterium]